MARNKKIQIDAAVQICKLQIESVQLKITKLQAALNNACNNILKISKFLTKRLTSENYSKPNTNERIKCNTSINDNVFISEIKLTNGRLKKNPNN